MDSKGVYCGNLSSRVTDELLYELFLQAGPVQNIVIPKDSAGDSRGYALVFYAHECTVNYAIELFRGTSLFGRELDLRPRDRGSGSEANRSLSRQYSTPHTAAQGFLQVFPSLPNLNQAYTMQDMNTYRGSNHKESNYSDKFSKQISTSHQRIHSDSGRRYNDRDSSSRPWDRGNSYEMKDHQKACDDRRRQQRHDDYRSRTGTHFR